MISLPPRPRARLRRRLSWIWALPGLAALATGYLAYDGWVERGPLITITFEEAEGLVPGQTQLRYRSVPIGTVQSLRLTAGAARAEATVRVRPEMAGRLTGKARFWLVRPRLSPEGVSGLETILSGVFIGFDPGPPSATRASAFTALEEPPRLLSSEAGQEVLLRASRLGGLRPGSAVTYRGQVVGEVVEAGPVRPGQEIPLRLFLRAPYDALLRAGPRFWRSGGVSAGFGPEGFHLELGDLRGLLGGAIALDVAGPESPLPADGFPLHDSAALAEAAAPGGQLVLATLSGPAAGLAPGAPVLIQGRPAGRVTQVGLAWDATARRFRVPVRLVLRPVEGLPPDALATLVAEGYRLRLRGADLFSGQQVLALEVVPGAPPATLGQREGLPVLPVLEEPGGDLPARAEALMARLERFPLEETGAHLNAVLAATESLAGGPELRGALTGLSGALAQWRGLAGRLDRDLTPLLRRLPQLAETLEQSLRQAGGAARSFEQAYGADSPTARQMERTLRQLAEAARALRLLADLLERRPEAMLSGRGE
ncbi:MlaD family protein [Roseomonas sp. GC11]|uniref:PqiB family protein n=1 Tax=Roseomonas sp. GC11 TaxID=2950546 RepID=UPI00210F0D79|nr:MlaD family protein [Roseomonas sp. GC11]MCQ4158813.1 MlaD family protein [Roseomonas sp. GC11]